MITFAQNAIAQHQPLAAYRDGQVFKFYEHNPHWLMFQDSLGFLWGFDKSRQLIRFDGMHTKTFTNNPNDSNSVQCVSNIFYFLQDQEGKIWISIAECAIERFDPKTERFEHFAEKFKVEKGGFLPGYFYNLFQDRRGNILAGSQAGTFVLSKGGNLFNKIGIDYSSYPILEDESGNIGILTFGPGGVSLQRFNLATWKGVHKQIFLPEYKSSGTSNSWPTRAFPIKGPSEELANNFVFVIRENLYTYNVATNEARNHNKLLNKGEWVSGLYVEGNTVLVGTTKGRLLQFYPKEERISVFVHLPETEEEEYPIFNIFKTTDGILWVVEEVRTYHIQPRPTVFKSSSYQTSLYPGSMNMFRTDEIIALNDNIYVFKQNSLYPLLETSNAKPLRLEMPSGKKRNFPTTRFCVDDQNNILWSITDLNGTMTLLQFDQEGNRLMESVPTWDGWHNLGGQLMEITLAPNGQLWLAFWNQVAVLNLQDQTGRVFRFDPDSDLPFAQELTHNTCIFADSKNRIWVGHHANGISCYDPETRKTHRYKHDPKDTTSLSTNLRISDIVEDAQGNIWVATTNGLNKWSPETRAFQRVIEQHPSYSRKVNSMILDNHQHIWFTANNHLVKYEPENHKFYTFGPKDGVPLSYFYERKTGNDATGSLFFASNRNQGILHFHPDSVQLDTVVPQLMLTALQVKNEQVEVGAEDGLLQQTINFTNRIRLQPDQNIFTISYAAIEYRFPEEIRYAVMLEGFHEEWQQVGDKREATFMNLDPGTYTFKVKVRSHHGFWSKAPRQLSIVILPPWYQTWWATTLWIILILSVVYWVYRFQLNRKLALAEAQQLKVLDQAKNRLYTNITHEFRTPLTIILGMADQIKSDPQNWFNEGIRLIHRNGKQLLQMVNQLLDLSKLESGHLPVYLINDDIIPFLQYLVESFHSFADSKDIRLHFITEVTSLPMDYDPEKLQHVISNLFSNAIKFTEAGGDVYMGVRSETVKGEGKTQRATSHQPRASIPSPLTLHSSLTIQIWDNGIGISPEHLPHIFNRFYQVDASTTRRGEGTGIGLALAKELTHAMGGNITVESQIDQGTKFTIILPITQNGTQASMKNSGEQQKILADTLVLENEKRQNISELTQSDRNLILLVEDNKDVLAYLSSFLANDYQIATAKNGQEGMDKAFELIPDLIVSDVMMPQKDGFELCETLKKDERSSHIPIILLTAKADFKSKIEGLSFGADAYLEKPFQKEELLVRIEQMIELRHKLQQRFQQAGSLRGIQQAPSPQGEDLFLQKVVRIIEANMGDTNFGMPLLCKAMNMSRSTLFRKIKALTGKSITLFIRSVRLENAKSLLETTDQNVTEVSFEVGFSSPNYFSRIFQEEFGMAPSEIKKS